MSVQPGKYMKNKHTGIANIPFALAEKIYGALYSLGKIQTAVLYEPQLAFGKKGVATADIHKIQEISLELFTLCQGHNINVKRRSKLQEYVRAKNISGRTFAR